MFKPPKNENIFPLTNKGVFKTLGRDIQFDERIITFDDVNGKHYVTTETKMYRLEYNGVEITPIRIW